MQNLNDKIFVAGSNGLVGRAIVNNLQARGFNNIILAPKSHLDLTNTSQVNEWFGEVRPMYVYDAAARVGGIHANNTYPAEFIYQNLAIQNNIINACKTYGVRKLMFLGSVCIYPKFAEEPVNEKSLLTGALEPTNEAYAVAKIAGIKMCQAYNKQYGCNFVSVMPCNLYGINDNFHPENSHVIPALLRKFDEAKMANRPFVMCWGTGAARREFLYVEDLADALIFLMDKYDSPEIINIGYGEDITIKELTEMISKVVGFRGEVLWDTTKSDGTPKRLLDSTKLFTLGWKPKTDLLTGLRSTYAWYQLHPKRQ